MDVLEEVPAWLLRPLPANAVADDKLHAEIDTLATNLPDSLNRLGLLLSRVRAYREYDAAANRAGAYVWRHCDAIFASPNPPDRLALLHFALAHMVEGAQARVCRRLVKDPDVSVRRTARGVVEKRHFHEVALPATPDGDWDASGWLRGTGGDKLSRHRQGRRVLESRGLPVLPNVVALRKLLGIKSPAQLGYFLLATDADGGPYTRFTIPKRDGGERVLCAPKKQLRWVQRQILDKILDLVPAHDAAHGFIPGRSTVTNAAPHLGAEVVLKFDLTDFFPTIHYHRVVGLFARLGYYVADGRFGTDDDAKRVAPTLARLCCWTPDAEQWYGALMPQGAPTSPAWRRARRASTRATPTT
ncbi:MAG TPA: reverse transcriptase family protein [Gemmataceae bacterium]|nr:reverse transcriptase family protein [Gemmataceae bacterium]